MSKLILILSLLGGVGFFLWRSSNNAPKIPELDLNEWWGPTETKGKQDTTIRPFQVKFSAEVSIVVAQSCSNLVTIF